MQHWAEEVQPRQQESSGPVCQLLWAEGKADQASGRVGPRLQIYHGAHERPGAAQVWGHPAHLQTGTWQALFIYPLTSQSDKLLSLIFILLVELLDQNVFLLSHIGCTFSTLTDATNIHSAPLLLHFHPTRYRKTSARFSRSWCQVARLRWWWRRATLKAASLRTRARAVQTVRGALAHRAAFLQWTSSLESASGYSYSFKSAFNSYWTSFLTRILYICVFVPCV